MSSTPLPWRPTLLGVAVGLVLSVVDVGALAWLGVEMRIAGRDAVPLVLAVFACTYAVLGGAIGAMVATRRQLQQDAEALRRANAELEATRAELVRMETLAALGRMAGGVAHEVRNPLGIIRSSAELVAEGLPTEGDAARACGFIVAEVDRLDRFVRRVLDLSRPLQARLEPVAVADLARRVAEREGVEVAGTGAILPLDAELTLGCLVELVRNARLAGADRVQLRTGQGFVEVADNGPGVPEADQGRLFTPFFTTRAEGTGLGLALAARIAEAQGATLRYRAAAGLGPDGAGACFRLSPRPS